jgi:hypothetical protein
MSRFKFILPFLCLLVSFSAKTVAQDFISELRVGPARLLTSGKAVFKNSLPPGSADDYYRGNASVARYGTTGALLLSRGGSILLRDPQSPRYASIWGEYYGDSVGSWSYYNDRGVIQTTQSPTYIPGGANPMRAKSYWTLLLTPALDISGTLPGEFRYRALDHIWAETTSTLAAAVGSTTDGRSEFDGSMVWSPAGGRYTADLVVTVRFGTDGTVTGGLNKYDEYANRYPPAYIAARQLDLDVLVAPTSLDMDGRQSIRIRKTGSGPGTRLEQGWTYNKWIESSAVYIKDDIKGTSTSAAISWGNGESILQGVPRYSYSSWKTLSFRLPDIQLPTSPSTTIKISGVSSNFSTSMRDRVVGKVKFPDRDVTSNPGLGNGIDFSVRLENLKLLPPVAVP